MRFPHRVTAHPEKEKERVRQGGWTDALFPGGTHVILL